MKRYAIKQNSTITTTLVNQHNKIERDQSVLAIFPSKKQALEWRNTWKNKESLKLIHVEIMEI